MSSDRTPQKVPKRVAMACVRCRERKVKCIPVMVIGVQRCERCQQHGHPDCEFKPVPPAATASLQPSSNPPAPVSPTLIPLYSTPPYQVIPLPHGRDQPFHGSGLTNPSDWNAQSTPIDPRLLGATSTSSFQPGQDTSSMAMTTSQGNIYPGEYSGQQQYPLPPQSYGSWQQPQLALSSYPSGRGGVDPHNSIGQSLPPSNPADHSNHPTDTYGRY